MNREQRLSFARNTDWVRNYAGNSIIKAYRKKHGVDILCAITELRSLGVAIDQEYEEQVRHSIEGAARAKSRKKAQREGADLWSDSDDTFAYIAGYTPGGVPFGVTWDEMDEAPPWGEEENEMRTIDYRRAGGDRGIASAVVRGDAF